MRIAVGILIVLVVTAGAAFAEPPASARIPLFTSGERVGVRGEALSGQIAHLRLTDGAWQVWVMRADGTDARQATRSPGDKVRISWFPDGRRLLVNTLDGRLWTVDLTSGTEKPVDIGLAGMTDARLSPDGQWVAFSLATLDRGDSNDLFAVRLSDGLRRKLTHDPGLEHSPAWSPDGQRLLYIAKARNQAGHLWEVRLDGRESRQFVHGPPHPYEPAVSVRGRIAVSSIQDGDYELVLLDSEGRAERRLTRSPGLDAEPSFSLDGRSLAFASTRSGHLAVWRMNGEDEELARLTPEGIPCRLPVWGPAVSRKEGEETVKR